ncbi:MAG TPA: AAA family ATPase [Nitrososphaeraceae archaeon]
MIVVVGGVKGGTGKTTIATNLTVIRSASGKKVLLVDADEQKSSSLFASQRDGLGIQTNWTTIQLGGADLRKQISRLKPDYDDIIIDVGGRETTSQRSALTIADVYVLPFNPASYDIWTIGQVNTIISDMKTLNEKLKAIAFINRADPSGSDNDDAISILEECKEFECLKLTVGNRKIFRTSSGEGLSVVEVKKADKKAVQEITDLYEYVYNKCTI